MNRRVILNVLLFWECICQFVKVSTIMTNAYNFEDQLAYSFLLLLFDDGIGMKLLC